MTSDDSIRFEDDTAGNEATVRLFKDDVSVAYLTYDRPGETAYVLTWVEVDTAHRGHGYAQILVEEMVRRGKEEGADLSATCGVCRAILQKLGAL